MAQEEPVEFTIFRADKRPPVALVALIPWAESADYTAVAQGAAKVVIDGFQLMTLMVLL